MAYFYYLYERGMLPEVNNHPVPTGIDSDGKVIFEQPHSTTWSKALSQDTFVREDSWKYRKNE